MYIAAFGRPAQGYPTLAKDSAKSPGGSEAHHAEPKRQRTRSIQTKTAEGMKGTKGL